MPMILLRRLFGRPETGAYGRAFRMGFAFLVFYNVLARLAARFAFAYIGGM